ADDPVTSLGSDAGEEVDDEGDYNPSTNDSAKDRPGSSSDDSEAVEDGEGEGKADKDGGKEKDEGDRDTSDESDAGFAPHAD
ncbi:porphyrin biosynthesis protein, partial [Klebsiella pneumoniae]|nr:porphyrin biosynthesis protein [Klebsiella pneumoniae]